MTLAIEAPAEGRRKAWIFALAMMAAILAVNLAAHLWRVQGHEPPEYGKWSGVLEVERKIRLLREFAREGPVDALILSSSMGDLGISAQVLTQEMSALLGARSASSTSAWAAPTSALIRSFTAWRELR